MLPTSGLAEVRRRESESNVNERECDPFCKTLLRLPSVSLPYEVVQIGSPVPVQPVLATVAVGEFGSSASTRRPRAANRLRGQWFVGAGVRVGGPPEAAVGKGVVGVGLKGLRVIMSVW